MLFHLLRPGSCLWVLLLPFSSFAQVADTPESIAKNILTMNCAGCHSPQVNLGAVGDILNVRQMIAAGLIRPNNSAGSVIYQSIAANRMPIGTPIDEISKKAVAAWIDAGAKDFSEGANAGNKPSERPAVSIATTLSRIVEDIKTVPASDRRFMRYLLVNHALRSTIITEIRKPLFAKAVAKGLNSVHWQRSLGVPVDVDQEQSAVRVDLRQFSMSSSEWNQAAEGYPYLSQLSGSSLRAIQSATQSQTPVLRADFFVRAISQPDLYARLLDLPDNLVDLESRLGVDALRNIRRGEVIRSGFKESGVSFSNRVMERHQGRFGAYWKSYDFLTSDGSQNVFRNPLGPLVADDPSVLFGEDNAFQHNGGEVIFTLPNGLHGYMLVDAAGNYLAVAPTEIVQDPSRRDRVVTNGTSCFSCHTAGWIPKADDVRGNSSSRRFGNSALNSIRRLYAAPATLDAAFQKDIADYLEINKKMGIMPAQGEPVSTVTLYYDGDLTVADMAAELETTEAELNGILDRNSSLKRSLGRVRNGKYSVRRSNFESNFNTLLRAVRGR